eukprot:2112387-Alexandrium_andersonii.AAC.1
MSASLVGSEMCIRDRSSPACVTVCLPGCLRPGCPGWRATLSGPRSRATRPGAASCTAPSYRKRACQHGCLTDGYSPSSLVARPPASAQPPQGLCKFARLQRVPLLPPPHAGHGH